MSSRSRRPATPPFPRATLARLAGGAGGAAYDRGMPISETLIRDLAGFKGQDAPVTSLYLDVDGRRPAL